MPSTLRAAYEEGVRRALVTDPFALKAIARSAGFRAVKNTILGWGLLFLILTAVGLVIRWVWRGFTEPPIRTP